MFLANLFWRARWIWYFNMRVAKDAWRSSVYSSTEYTFPGLFSSNSINRFYLTLFLKLSSLILSLLVFPSVLPRSFISIARILLLFPFIRVRISGLHIRITLVSLQFPLCLSPKVMLLLFCETFAWIWVLWKNDKVFSKAWLFVESRFRVHGSTISCSFS
jgi:hypothetical protein